MPFSSLYCNVCIHICSTPWYIWATTCVDVMVPYNGQPTQKYAAITLLASRGPWIIRHSKHGLCLELICNDTLFTDCVNPLSAWGHFKNTYQLVNLGALRSSLLNKLCIFQYMGKIFCVEFQGYLWNFTQNMLPIHWNVENLRALRFTSSYEFFKYLSFPTVYVFPYSCADLKNIWMPAQLKNQSLYLHLYIEHFYFGSKFYVTFLPNGILKFTSLRALAL